MACAASLLFALPANAAIIPTTTGLSLDHSSVGLNQPVTMTATVTATTGTGAPTGTVTFNTQGAGGSLTPIGTAPLLVSGVGSATATFTTSSLAAGSYQIVATYGGAFLAFGSSQSPAVALTVAGAVIHNTTTTVTYDHSPITAGDNITFTAHVAETDGVTVPTGTVTFESRPAGASDFTVIGQANVNANGDAVLSVGGWQAGTYTVMAEYGGDQFDHGSTGQVTFVVAPTGVPATDTTTSVVVDPSAIQAGSSVDITATVTQSGGGAIPPAGDHVNFYSTVAGSSEQVFLGSGDVTWDGNSPGTGVATLTVGGWQAGFYTIEADFTGDTFDNPSSGRASLGVTSQSPTTLTYNGDTSVPVGTSANVSFQLLDAQSNPVAAEPVTITVNGHDYSATTNANGTASVAVTLPVGSYGVNGSFAGDANYLASSGSGTLVVTRIPTTIVYTGDTTASGGHTATLSAKLTDQNGNPLAGKVVTLSFGSESCQGTTNSAGSASCTVTVADAPGAYTVTASFAGDSTYQPSSGTGTIVVTGKLPTKIVDNTTGNFLLGSTATLSATLTTNGAPLPGKTVYLTLGLSACHAVTDASGNATCTVTVPGPTGPTLSTASYLGDASSNAALDAKPALIYAYAPGNGGGSFVVGDKSASGNVYFWGSQWAKNNSLSGGAADNSFKGFALSPATPQCGGTWTTDPGNSAPPPRGPLPAYMAVAVTSKTTKSGKTISGTVVHVVIVKTNPGYDANPGHAGTGTVVATLC